MRLIDVEYEPCREAHGGMAVFENYGKTWLVYRRKPCSAYHKAGTQEENQNGT